MSASRSHVVMVCYFGASVVDTTGAEIWFDSQGVLHQKFTSSLEFK